MDYYIANPDIEPTTIVNMDIGIVAYQSEPVHKWCGMGGQMIAYDINGVKYPCHFFQGMNSEKMKCAKIENIDFSCIQDTLSDKCKLCILRNSCSTCYGYNFLMNNSFGKKDDNLCAYKKASALATSTLLYRKIQPQKKKFDDRELSEKEIIFAIQKIQEAAINNDWCVNMRERR